MLKIATKRNIVTIEDRRVVFMAARNRKERDVIVVPNKQFIRNMLKDRMGWPRCEPAPESVKAVANEMANALAEWKAPKHPSVGACRLNVAQPALAVAA